jgi:hypothetical protein
MWGSPRVQRPAAGHTKGWWGAGGVAPVRANRRDWRQRRGAAGLCGRVECLGTPSARFPVDPASPASPLTKSRPHWSPSSPAPAFRAVCAWRWGCPGRSPAVRTPALIGGRRGIRQRAGLPLGRAPTAYSLLPPCFGGCSLAPIAGVRSVAGNRSEHRGWWPPQPAKPCIQNRAGRPAC